jgi:hypothetical protein
VQVLTHVMDTHYESPSGFEWEPPSHWGDSQGVTASNIQQRADELMHILAQRAGWYRTPLLFFLLGGDFEYQDPAINFGNMTLLMDYINDHPERYEALHGLRPQLHYATPSEYFSKLRALAPSLPLVTGSHFLPLITINPEGGSAGAWSGYYSGYPELKEATRAADSLLRTAEAMAAVAGSRLPERLRASLADARRDVDLLPHHDNIVATGVNFNNVDMMVRLRRASRALQAVVAGATAALAQEGGGGAPRGQAWWWTLMSSARSTTAKTPCLCCW